VSFDFQYILNKHIYLSSKLKYSYIKDYYGVVISFVDFNPSLYMTNANVLCAVSLHNLEIPVIANWSIPINDNFNFVASCGLGLDLNVSNSGAKIVEEYYVLGWQNAQQFYNSDFDVYRNTNYFVNVGIAFDYLIKNHKLQTSLAFNWYPEDMYRWRPTRVSDFTSDTFSKNNIEVGLTFFW
jgi:hypothetical protein